MRENLGERRSFVGQRVEDFRNEIDGGGGKVVIGREFVVVLLDLLVDVLDVLGLERRLPNEKCVPATSSVRRGERGRMRSAQNDSD